MAENNKLPAADVVDGLKHDQLGAILTNNGVDPSDLNKGERIEKVKSLIDEANKAPPTQEPDKVPAIPKTPIGGTPSKDKKPEDFDKKNSVLMNFPHSVRVTLRDRTVIAFQQGTRRVPSFLANVPDKNGKATGKMHWYLVANGVTLLEEDA